MLIAATSDIHAPYNLKIFRESLYNIYENPDIFILAGDIIDGSNHMYLKKVYSIIKERFPNTKIVSVFGNNEYYQHRNMLKKDYSFMGWLDDSYIDLGEYYIFGTEGVLDALTPWKKKNMPEIWGLWVERLRKIDEILNKLKDKEIIFVSHYAPICETTFGDTAPKQFLCSERMKKIVEKYGNIKLIIHGHSHLAKIYKYKFKNAEVYNVSFYIHKRPILFRL